ncbi:hypothetical protein M231_07942 [Tremella mesenterica]|uniref:Uncharacterized protein n=1 Tax=Tremella mesenterica TaxID=5217 RepID=A0A4Q1BA16_TREME|nr:hypothetical protein M231_07942 [Tremella mesenterica]
MTQPTNHFFTASLSIDQHLSRIEFDPRVSYDQDRDPSEAQRRITKTGLLIIQRTWPRLEDLPTLHVGAPSLRICCSRSATVGHALARIEDSRAESDRSDVQG